MIEKTQQKNPRAELAAQTRGYRAGVSQAGPDAGTDTLETAHRQKSELLLRSTDPFPRDQNRSAHGRAVPLPPATHGAMACMEQVAEEQLSPELLLQAPFHAGVFQGSSLRAQPFCP